jgi:hypothetical protein
MRFGARGVYEEVERGLAGSEEWRTDGLKRFANGLVERKAIMIG